MNVLIVKKAALGDVLRTTSLLPALRRAGARPVTWLTAPAAAPLLAGHPDVGRVVTSGARLPRTFDLVLSLEEDLSCARWARRACGGRLVGVVEKDGALSYTEDSEPYYGMSLLRPDRAKADRLKAANRLSYAQLWLKILGLPPPAHVLLAPSLFLSERERAWAKAFWRRRGWKDGEVIGFNPGAGRRWPSKQLTVEASVAVAGALLRSGRPLLLLGGKEEAERNASILAALPRGRAAGHPSLPLRRFCALIERCAALVAADSLACHVAAALGRPAAVLVGPTSASELDLGRGRVLTPPGACRCFYQARCTQAVACLSRIAPARVARAVESLLS